MLESKGIEYQEIRIDQDEKAREKMMVEGRRTVPQIFINDQAIGGYDDLYALDKAGKLDALLTG